jgi:hypothetical protein
MRGYNSNNPAAVLAVLASTVVDSCRAFLMRSLRQADRRARLPVLAAAVPGLLDYARLRSAGAGARPHAMPTCTDGQPAAAPASLASVSTISIRPRTCRMTRPTVRRYYSRSGHAARGGARRRRGGRGSRSSQGPALATAATCRARQRHGRGAAWRTCLSLHFPL